MNAPRTLWALTVVVVTLSAALVSAAPAPDAARILAPPPEGFKRPTVLVYPLVDMAPLAEVSPAVVSTPAAQSNVPAFDAFVSALSRYPNLRVVAPASVVSRIKARRTWLEGVRVGAARADEGRDASAQVRLEDATRALADAARVFHEVEHAYVDPRAVARTELARASTLLEQGDALEANEAFVAALSTDARTRLRPEYDRAETIAALERARLGLLTAPRAPERFTRWPASESAAADVFIVRARHHAAQGGEPARLELVVVSANGTLVPETQPLPAGVPAEEAGGRLASRLFACLPFGGAAPVRRATREVRADVGGAGFVFLENPLDPFGHVGAAVHLTTQIAKRVSIETMAMVSNSIADSSAQITESMVTLRGAIAPGFETRLGAARLEAHVGLEVASPGAFVTSSNVYCRHFGVPTDGLGYQACVDGGGLDRTPRRVLVGAYASLGASLDLPEDLYLVARLNYAEYLFASGSSDLGRPLGGALSLGYQLR